jgi:large subunit ribosomal protein L28e
MSQASNDVIWQCVRKQSCFLSKRGHFTVDTHPANLTGKNSYKNSPLANDRAVGVSANAKFNGVVLTIKKRNSRKIRGNSYQIPLNRVHNPRRINKVVSANSTRVDLTDTALAKASALAKALRTAPVVEASLTGKDRDAAFRANALPRAVSRAQRRRNRY